MELPDPTALQHGFDGLIGLEVLEHSEEVVRARVPVRDELKQPMGLVHGGLYASIAESLASMATALVVMAENKMAMGLANQTSFLRPITDGTVHAVARRLHRGRTTWVWDVEITDDAGRLCALTRMTSVATEGTGSDLDPGRRLTALVLGQVDQADDALDLLGGQALGRQFAAAQVELHVAVQDSIQQVIGRQ
jgi:uncharacterized protein (TIGR00369 family)